MMRNLLTASGRPAILSNLRNVFVALLLMTHEQARAVARDPRVSEVLPNNPRPVD